MGTWGMFPLNIMSTVRDLCLPRPSRKYRKEWISPSPTTQELLNKLDWQHWVGTMAMWDREGQVQKCNLGVVLGLQCPNSEVTGRLPCTVNVFLLLASSDPRAELTGH